ncbi:MAG: phosphate transport system regulatory protein PhoU [Spirochaetes bacterium RBG_13_51_14]|nr:MAG: phosphate transport system regulatory protein PhoU [Spirochaetes bacterium RBG_13_51_14]
MERHFDEELTALKNQILEMGAITERMVSDVLKALMERDGSILKSIEENENTVNRMQMEIDECCLKLIALHQPTANDLRLLMGVSKINAELERVGDHALNISKLVTAIIEHEQLKPFIDLPKMVEIARGMFKESLRAFVELDVDKATSILLRDDQVDELRNKIVDELIQFMCGDSSTVQVALRIILLANNLEKIADHATNIAEVVIFVAQGKDIRHHAEPLT